MLVLAEIEKYLVRLGFHESIQLGGLYSIAHLFRPSQRCGIYVLHFENGQYYAGQAIDVTRRYIQHRKSHLDISRISFIKIKRENLGLTERDVIAKLEKKGFVLRNISYTSIPCFASDFEGVMNKQQQARWINDRHFRDVRGTRLEHSKLRTTYESRFGRFLKKPHADRCIRLLREYGQNTIPALKRGEQSFWSCSCLPSDSRDIYLRVNIFQQEVFTLMADKGKLYASWHIARSPLERKFGIRLASMRAALPWLNVSTHLYPSGGFDQINIVAEGFAAAARTLENQVLVEAIRLFNLRLMQKGACLNYRSHCMQLADQICMGL